MLQIISNSNETKTGPELVQNGDFSQLGTDLVENGEFDELGTDVITNGGFTGVTELVADGDFSLTGTQAESTTGTYWTTGSKWVINSNSAYTDATAYSNLSTYSVFESGKTYTITVEVSGGNCRVYFGTSATTLHLLTDGLNTITAVAEGTKLTFRAYTTPTTISNVSVKEEGEDWTQGIGWTIGDSKATSTQALGSEEVTNGDFSDVPLGGEEIVDGSFPNGSTAWNLGNGGTIVDNEMQLDCGGTTNAYTYQSKATAYTSGKSYKLTVKIVSNTTGTDLILYAGGFSPNTVNISIGTTPNTYSIYFVADYTSGSGNTIVLRAFSSTGKVVIDSVSVKEVINLVDNPNFTDTGSELMANYDFASGLTDWNPSGVTESGGVVYINASNQSINQGEAFALGNSYKAVIEGAGDVRYRTGTAGADATYLPITLPATVYFVATADSSIFQVRGSNPSSSATVSSVSVKELGADWSVTMSDGSATTSLKYVEFVETGARFVSDVTAAPYLYLDQSTLSSGKLYKFTCNVAYTDVGSIKVSVGGGGYVTLVEGLNTIYSSAPTTSTQFRFIRASDDVDCIISNISVKEIATSYLTQAVSLSAKTWKIIYSVSDYIAGSVSATDYGAVTTANAVGITEYVQIGVASDFRMVNIGGYFEGAVTDISAQLVDPNGYWSMGAGWTLGSGGASHTGSAGTLQQLLILESGKSYKVLCSANSVTGTLAFVGFSNSLTERTIPNGDTTFYLTANSTTLGIYSDDIATITNISVEQVDPNDYWTLGTGWSIGTDKAISTVTGSNSDITQSILTAGKTYRTVYEIVDYDAGTAQAVVTGSAGADAVAIETYTEDLTTTGTDFSIRSKLGTFDGAVSSVSAKLLGSYEDQSIYVTAADVQTLPQASVYYLVELTSMASKNSIYFIPSSVVPNNGRYTKLNFTVVSKDALTQPTVGIISFYDSAGGFDTYPMGFYEFKIYEQTSSTNLDPLLATGLLEKGFAFVRDFSGNMQELTDGFKEYNPTLTQYVYSK